MCVNSPDGGELYKLGECMFAVMCITSHDMP